MLSFAVHKAEYKVLVHTSIVNATNLQMKALWSSD